jgi:hypothetical protein
MGEKHEHEREHGGEEHECKEEEVEAWFQFSAPCGII